MLGLKLANTQNEEKVTAEVKIIQVTSPSTIQDIARERDLNPQEVFVRVVFELDGQQYKASNKLKILGKNGYKELLEAKKNGTPITITVGLESEFFYIEKDVSIDDLFAEELPKQPSAAPFAKLSELLKLKK
jgi:hypothetical protein